MIKNLKHLFFQYYIDFYEKEYLSVINSIRIVISVLAPMCLYIYTKNQTFIWLGTCCLLWALHMYMQNKTAFIFKSMYFSLIICIVLQLLGFVAQLNLFAYLAFSFFIAFLIPYAAYFKQAVLYSLSVYFIVQNSVFFETGAREMTVGLFLNLVAFFSVVFVGLFVIRINVKKLIMYRSKVNFNFLIDYLEHMQRFILMGTKRNYESLGKRREDLFRSLQFYREFYPAYKATNSKDILLKMAPIQERFIETVIGFCVQIRHIHTVNEDVNKIKEIFAKLSYVTRQQRILIFEAQHLQIHEVIAKYRQIFTFAKRIPPVPDQASSLSKKELDELNAAILQLKESIELMETDIGNIFLKA